jgi:hypothetical protein
MLAQETGSGAHIPHGGQLTDLIHGALVRMVGPANAEAIEFYVDTRLAVEDPEAYERSMRLLLREHGGRLVIDGLKTELASRSGAERSNESFFGQVRATERALRRPKKTGSASAAGASV